MSDPRFARLRTDPRFRRIHKKDSKVVVDDRFASLFDGDAKSKKKQKKGKGRVDKYGRQLSETHERDNLRRFYRLEGEEEDGEAENEDGDGAKKPDYARGQVLLESSDEEDAAKDDESDDGGVVTLRRVEKKHVLDDDDEPEIDLDEDNFADLDAQAAAYAQEHEEEDVPDASHTRRIAVVNLDWDHVRATHLYKIFSSLVSTSASAVLSEPAAPRPNERKRGGEKGGVAKVVRGKVLSVRVYPSEFGKERLAREQTEGPPVEVFKKKTGEEEGVRDDTSDVGDAEDYNEEALRKYQLERLRYYYAIAECDTVEAASHIYSELEGTELERSANVFDLSFVPDEMTFDNNFRDEATDDINAPYKPVEFVTDALRHSKVKLTWDDDDPERNQLTRRALTRKEMEENDFRAYLASSTESESERDEAGPSKGKSKGKSKADRDRLRALLLGGGDDTLPEGWGDGKDGDDDDVDMEITFTPGLSEAKNTGDETTLEKYKRKMKEKKTKRKEERRERGGDAEEGKTAGARGLEDDFFAQGSGDESDAEEKATAPVGKKGKKGKRRDASPAETNEPRTKTTSTAEELALVAVSDNPNAEPKHFDMKAVLKAEKSKGKKRKGKKGKKGEQQEQEPELQEEFAIDVKDDRFKAVHEDHTFAIDPSNPHFKKTKSMSALLEERSKRQKNKLGSLDGASLPKQSNDDPKDSLKSLVESVKRKSATAAVDRPMGKRRKL